MKKFRKVLASALVLVALFSMASPAFAVESEKLRFNENGKFTVLQFADCQDTQTPKQALLMFMEKALDEVKPDLVVFTGDNISGGGCSGEENTQKAIDAILKPVVDRGIPFTITFGNHDAESGVSKERQLEIYQSYPGCYAYDASPDLFGCATHNLPVYSSTGNEVKFNFWLIDSNEYDRERGGYDHVHEDQIQWYTETSKQLEKDNGGKVPSLLFQHIIVPEVYEDLMPSSSVDTAITRSSHYPNANFLMTLDYKKASGLLLEWPCPPRYNSGQLDAISERGDVLGMVFGHDHINEFIGKSKGVDLIQTPGAGWNSYGRYYTRGARVFVIDENNNWNYETYMYNFTDAFGYGLKGFFTGAYYGEDAALYIPIALAGVAGFLAILPALVRFINIVT